MNAVKLEPYSIERVAENVSKIFVHMNQSSHAHLFVWFSWQSNLFASSLNIHVLAKV